MAEADKKKVTRVLIAIDDSENCQQAFEYYVEHIHKPSNKVILFHVSDQVKLSHYAVFEEGIAFYDDDAIERSVNELRKKNKDIQEKYEEKCKSNGIDCEFILYSDDSYGPGHSIVQIAKKKKAHLIIVGSRGLGAIKRTIMGSVSTYVIHHGHVPAMVCPPE